jgi:hypothetical protein
MAQLTTDEKHSIQLIDCTDETPPNETTHPTHADASLPPTMTASPTIGPYPVAHPLHTWTSVVRPPLTPPLAQPSLTGYVNLYDRARHLSTPFFPVPSHNLPT